jgi:hypothetical protein
LVNHNIPKTNLKPPVTQLILLYSHTGTVTKGVFFTQNQLKTT